MPKVIRDILYKERVTVSVHGKHYSGTWVQLYPYISKRLPVCFDCQLGIGRMREFNDPDHGKVLLCSTCYPVEWADE